MSTVNPLPLAFILVVGTFLKLEYPSPLLATSNELTLPLTLYKPGYPMFPGSSFGIISLKSILILSPNQFEILSDIAD